jgi:hypothetical protein
LKNSEVRCVQANVKTMLRTVLVSLTAVIALSSCGTDPYYAGNYGGQPTVSPWVPLVAAGVAAVALGSYAKEREHREERKQAVWAWNSYYGYGHRGYGCRPPHAHGW